MAHDGLFIPGFRYLSWLDSVIRERFVSKYRSFLINRIHDLSAPPLLSPTNFRNSEQSTTRGNRPLLETIRSSSTILFPLHTDRGAFRLSGVRTLGERSGQRAALRVLETPLLRSRSSRSWFILNVAERIELIRFRETVGKNITRIYIYIYPIFAITKITRGAFRFELFTVRLFRMNGLFYRRRKLRIFWKRFKYTNRIV